ncbi:MAG: hypothetical protein Q7J78_04790 [Clostridiales bacterium]|nr:hypothetical protein [Clostridiales bacterium]
MKKFDGTAKSHALKPFEPKAMYQAFAKLAKNPGWEEITGKKEKNR